MVDKVDFYLSFIGLDILKITLIVSLFFAIYCIRKVLYVSLEKYLASVDLYDKYFKSILDKIRKPIETTIILINIKLSIYIYNDFIINEAISKIFNILYAVLAFVIFYRILNTVSSIKLGEISLSERKIKNEMINVSIKIINFMIFVVGLLVVLKIGGVDITAILSGLGIGGLAVALASKDSLSNFFGTISILLSDVFSQGDWIEVNSKEGVVVEIGLRVTTLRTFDNALISIPNSLLASQEVKNWNKRELGRRIKMKLGIKYDSKPKDIKNAILEIREMLLAHKDIATSETKSDYHDKHITLIVSKDDLVGVKKTLLVFLDEFSDSSINILVYCFSKSVIWEEWLATKQDVMHKIMEIFEKNNLEFAFPSLSLYNENEKEIEDANNQ